MLAKMIDKIISLKDTKTFLINGENYSDRELYRIKPVMNHPSRIRVSGLDGICKIIRKEYLRNGNMFVQIDDYNRVTVFTEYKEDYLRDVVYEALSDVPGFMEGWRERNDVIIKLRSLFIPNEGSKYLLELLSKMSEESNVSTTDNGITQVVEAKQGVSLKANVPVKPIVKLTPFRTFLEVEQPSSDYLVRVREGEIGLFEADGGVWKLEAKQNIAAFLEKQLADMIEIGQVTILK